MSNGCPRASEGYHLGVSQVVVNDISRYCINTTLKYLLFWFNKIYLDSKRISALLLLHVFVGVRMHCLTSSAYIVAMKRPTKLHINIR